LLQKDEFGEMRLELETDGGRRIQGGVVSPDGDMAIASQDLFRQFFAVWGMSDLTLNVTLR
jgi:hypothetical protein